MSHIKLCNFILIFLCITSNNFSVLSEPSKLSELEKAVKKSLRISTTKNDVSYNIELHDSELFLYGYFVQPAPKEKKTDMYLNIFYTYMNCSFAEWLQNKLFEFIKKFPIFYQSKFQNTYNNEFNKRFVGTDLIQKLNDIDSYVRRFISILLHNFLHLADSRDNDTSLLKTMLLLQFKIHFLTLPSDTKQADDIVVRSILEIMNLIQMFMATNCAVHTYNETRFINDRYFIKSSHFFNFWITRSAETNETINNILYRISQLGLEYNNKSCNTDEMLLVNIVAETPDHLVLREISHAEVFLNSKTIKIYQLLQKIEKRECDLELIFWYQESVFDAIVKLIYSKMITALQQENSKPEEIVKSIPQFIELPTDVSDYFTSQTYYDSDKINKLIEKITYLRNSITNIILETVDATENQKVSELNEFTTYMDSKSKTFYCYISVRNFLRKEFAKYYIPFIRNVLKVDHIVFEDMPIDEIVRSDVDDKLSDSSRCQYVRDLYSLCLEATTFLKMIFNKERDLEDEYVNQVNTILNTIRKRSINVIELCTYNGCRDLLKVSYYIYVVLNPKHKHHDVINKRLNSFVQSLEAYQNVSIVENYSTFLNIDNFFKNYLEEMHLFIDNKPVISFFYKGERKYIDEIYKNISAIIMDPSHVFKLYDIYFKFILGSVFYEVWVFGTYVADNPRNYLGLEDCTNFHFRYTMFLDNEHFPANLSILVSYVDRFSTLVYDICNQEAKMTKHDHKKKPHSNPYIKVGELKENIEKQFEKFGMFITKSIEKITDTTVEKVYHFLFKKTNLIEKVFKQMTVNTCKLVKDAYNMLTKLILDTYLMEG
ncbi:uncharacterized protein LOC115034079 [Acyrthosiphon pisum]|uniref:Uncharacterized protein n=1 Tax=Acyrthosiphon pisum TaxID=7029 RepID=A0A8R2NQ90_ACYPI|nr:uncharacterized protein LOC115034079 [Acyrthosiphon pisum]